LSKLSESERRFILEKLKELEEKEGSGSNFQNSDLRDRQSDDNDRPTALDLLLEKKKQEQEASDNSSESSTDQPTSVNQPNDTNTDVTSSNDTNTDATSSNDSNTDTTSTGQPINDSTNQPTTDEFSGGIPDDAPTQGEVAVSRFEVSASQTNLAPGGTAVLSGRVYFSNGDWGDVTTLTTWTLQPDDLTGQYAGTLRGNLFVAGQYGGKAYITGAVLGPDSRTYTDKVTITVLIMGNR